jgi:HK97 family phage major capsid protein
MDEKKKKELIVKYGEGFTDEQLLQMDAIVSAVEKGQIDINKEGTIAIVDEHVNKLLKVNPQPLGGQKPLEEEKDLTFQEFLRKVAGTDPGGSLKDPGAAKFLLDRNAKLIEKTPTLKDLYVGSNAAGGYLVPTEESNQLINLVQQNSAIRPLCRTIPMAAQTITIPTLTGGLTAYWVPEAGSTETLVSNTYDDTDQTYGMKPRSSLTFGQMTITNYVLAIIVAVSNQLLADSNPKVDGILRGIFAETIAYAEDLAFLRGGGITTAGATYDPISGIINQIATNIFAVGAIFNFDDIADLLGGVEENSRGVQEIPILYHPKVKKVLRKIKDLDGRYLWAEAVTRSEVPTLWGEPLIREWNLRTNLGVGTNESEMVAGDFRFAYIGDREGISIDVNTQGYPFWQYNQTAFRVEKRVGFNLADEARFSILNGVPTT